MFDCQDRELSKCRSKVESSSQKISTEEVQGHLQNSPKDYKRHNTHILSITKI